MPAIELYNMTKRFRAYSTRDDRWLRRELLGALLGRETPNDYLTALDGINLEVGRGEIVGLIGRNGAGKTTLLKLIAGIIQPTSGRMSVNGKVCALLELGAGFSPDLTARENVFLYGTIIGLEEGYIRKVLPEMIEFAELDGFLDKPLKHCSSGMQARLGFAVAMTADPDIFLLDEILAVGDQGFRQRCEARLVESFGGKTILLASHDLDAVRALCKRAIWLESGRIQADGPADEVVDAYLASFTSDAVEAAA